MVGSSSNSGTTTTTTTTTTGNGPSSSSSSSSLSPRDIYESTGDAAAALQVLEDKAVAGAGGDIGGAGNDDEDAAIAAGSTLTPQEEYNHLILSALCGGRSNDANDADDDDSDRNGDDAAAGGSDSKDPNDFFQRLDLARMAVLASPDGSSGGSGGGTLAENNSSTTATRKRRREEWIVTYNRGLALLATGKAQQSIRAVLAKLQPAIVGMPGGSSTSTSTSSTVVVLPPDLLKIACRMGFLVLENILTLWPMKSIGREEEIDPEHLQLIVSWLTENIERKDVGSEDPQLKFLLSIYKSRLDFFERDRHGKLVDSHIRSARKELKTAMEVFQQKLLKAANVNTETGSLASSSSAGGGGGGGSDAFGSASERRANTKSSSPILQASSSQHFAQPAMSRVLQAQNQAALILKANTEQLKGNVKKSLILCSEALGSVTYDEKNQEDDKTKLYYDAIHQNNLGIVYEASGKSHLALHSLSKAIRSASAASSSSTGANTGRGEIQSSSATPSSSVEDAPSGGGTAPCAFDSDGTVRPDLTLQILHNSVICSLKTGNYMAAYECMAICISEAVVYRFRPRSWIRLAEACIGLETKRKLELKDKQVSPFTAASCSTIVSDGKPKGLLLSNSANGEDLEKYRYEGGGELPDVGSPEDFEFLKTRPLVRARSCLEMALDLYSVMTSIRDELAQQSARLSLAYVCLENKEFSLALEHSKAVLDNGSSLLESSGRDDDNEDDNTKSDDKEAPDASRLILIKRQLATARMYASEASAAMGDPIASMNFIVGDKKENAIDRLAIDLSGVTIEMANNSAKAKMQLAKSQSMIRCNASAAWAMVGNHSVSRQLAMSAQAMESSYSASRDDSAARKALIYGMLREGNQGAALLTLLRSAR